MERKEKRVKLETAVKAIAVSGNEIVVNFNYYKCPECVEIIHPDPISYKFESTEEALKTYEEMIQ